jgi:hypothetical protein
MILNECIIIGGGKSIQDGLNLNLQPLLANKFVIATNYSYKHFPHTLMCFCDRDFYYPNQNCIKNKCHPYIYDELKKLPLIVGINHSGVEEFKLPNTYFVNSSAEFREITDYREGFYCKNFLTGVFAISLASFLLNYKGIIYLLGFDYTKQGATHYYTKEEINHRGQGWTNSYASHNPDNIFMPFEELEDIKIYNVSPESNIKNFEQINYPTMFNSMNNVGYNQEKLRQYIKSKLSNIS